MNFCNVFGKLKKLLLQLMSCSASGKSACGATPNAHCGYLKKKGSNLLLKSINAFFLLENGFLKMMHHNSFHSSVLYLNQFERLNCRLHPTNSESISVKVKNSDTF